MYLKIEKLVKLVPVCITFTAEVQKIVSTLKRMSKMF